MSFIKLFLTVFKFLATLWITITCVFLLSRLLPSSSTPKGMLDIDFALSKTSNSTILNKVKNDYIKRKGLDKPLFYITFSFIGKEVVKEIGAFSTSTSWLEAATLRHGLNETKTFHHVVEQWSNTSSPEAQKLAITQLLLWADSRNEKDQLLYEKEFVRLIQLSKQFQSNKVVQAWHSLLAQDAPLIYFLPVIKWNGTENIYHEWLTNICRGDLGISTLDYRPVIEKVSEAVYISSLLSILGLVVAVIISFNAGIHLVLYPESIFATVLIQFLYLLDSIPAFLLALSILGVFLLSGGSLLSTDFLEFSQVSAVSTALLNPSLLLGSLFISILVCPHLTLQFHRNLLEQSGSLYLRSAMAKGLSFRKALTKHALPNALPATLILLSEIIISLVAGVLIVEITFSIPGIGSLLTHSVLAGDYPIVIGITLFLLLFRLAVVWSIDLINVQLDPRIKDN